jgi:hypothetical protein
MLIYLLYINTNLLSKNWIKTKVKGNLDSELAAGKIH